MNELEFAERDVSLIRQQIREELSRSEKGVPKNSRLNFRLVLEKDPLLSGAFRKNMLSEQTDIVKPVWWEKVSPAFVDMDRNHLMQYLEQEYNLTDQKKFEECIHVIADLNRYHPVQDYLNSLVWDGKPRIGEVLTKFFGASKDDLTEACMRMMLLGAISRVFHPGIKFDYVLCIVGGQGIGKSSFFRLLAVNDDWFCDDIRKLEDENIYRRIRGHWLIEMSEMVATARSKSVEETKSFITRQKDNYKDLYALHAVDRPRQCVFVGSTNKQKFLPFDRTGNRRFLPIIADREKMQTHILDDESASRAYIDQLWAEAMTIYRSGDFSLSFDKSTEARLERLRADCMAEDTDAGIIQAWLDEHKDRRVCSRMLYKEALDHPYTKPKKAETDIICEIMNTSIVGWEPSTQYRFKEYGTQRSWVCVDRHCQQGQTKPSFEQQSLDLDGFCALPDTAKTPF